MDIENPTIPNTTLEAPAPAAPAVPPVANTSPEAIAAALMTALDSRTKRVEVGVAKSMAEQYGIPDEEINQILQAEKAKRAAQLPPEMQAQVQAQVEKAHNLLIAAEIKSVGSAMGLLDSEAALLLMGKDSIKVDDHGLVLGVQDALNTLKTSKPYLFTKPGAWGERQGSTITTEDGVTEAFTKLNPNLKIS